jgi:hypothetical protein
MGICWGKGHILSVGFYDWNRWLLDTLIKTNSQNHSSLSESWIISYLGTFKLCFAQDLIAPLQYHVDLTE